MTHRTILADILAVGLLLGTAQCRPAPEKASDTPSPPANSQPASPEKPATAASLENTYWKLTHLGDTPVTVAVGQQEPHLTLNSVNGRAGGSGGCNRFGGRYKLDGDRLSFEPMAMTMMACPENMETENGFLGALKAVRGWRIIGQQLELMDGAGKVVARFEARHLG